MIVSSAKVSNPSRPRPSQTATLGCGPIQCLFNKPHRIQDMAGKTLDLSYPRTPQTLCQMNNVHHA
jgi:hypothetical protein